MEGYLDEEIQGIRDALDAIRSQTETWMMDYDNLLDEMEQMEKDMKPSSEDSQN